MEQGLLSILHNIKLIIDLHVVSYFIIPYFILLCFAYPATFFLVCHISYNNNNNNIIIIIIIISPLWMDCFNFSLFLSLPCLYVSLLSLCFSFFVSSFIPFFVFITGFFPLFSTSLSISYFYFLYL